LLARCRHYPSPTQLLYPRHHRIPVTTGLDPVVRDELLLRKPLGILNGALAGREFLVSDGFTVADLNVASILVWGKMARLDLSAHREVTRWLDECLARPAYGRVRARRSERSPD